MDSKEILLEKAFTDALESVEGLSGRVCPIAEIQLSAAPLVTFLQRQEEHQKQLTGQSGLLGAEYEVHVMHDTYTAMRSLAGEVKEAAMQLASLPAGDIVIEDVSVELAAPDLFENRVGLYRRSYLITILYQ